MTVRRDDFAGTWTLVRVALRRDRIMIPAWIAGLAAFAYSSGAATKDLYPTAVSRLVFAAGAGTNRATIALYGPGSDLGTLGGLATWKMSAFGSVLVAVMSLLLVVRHTRADEEAGRLELLGAGVVGRRAPLGAGLVTAAFADALVGLICWLALVAGGLPVVGSLAFALAMVAAGLMFATVAAVTAQLTESSRTANGIAFAVLGGSYLLRALGDAAGSGSSSSWPSWLSPIGWTQQLRPYGPIRWWVLALPVLFVVALGIVAFALLDRRDVGAGLLATGLGPAEAAPSLRSSLALTWRLDRIAVLAWGGGFIVLGAASGAIAAGVADLAKDSPSTRDLFYKLGGHHGLINAYLATMIGFLGLLAAAYATQTTLRMPSEETSGRLEPLLATPLRRLTWAVGHLSVVVAGTAALLTVGGAAAGLTYGIRVHDIGGQMASLLGAALAQLPAVLVVAAVAVIIYGVAPRWSPAAWAVLGACLLLGQLGPLLHLGQWAMDLSPFTHVPHLPGGPAAAAPLVWLTVTAAAIGAIGLAALRHRDIA